jgi:hypothetical protein
MYEFFSPHNTEKSGAATVFPENARRQILAFKSEKKCRAQTCNMGASWLMTAVGGNWPAALASLEFESKD